MARTLLSTVHVRTPDRGTVVYGPGDEVPDQDADLITNEKVWSEPKAASKAKPETGFTVAAPKQSAGK